MVTKIKKIKVSTDVLVIIPVCIFFMLIVSCKIVTAHDPIVLAVGLSPELKSMDLQDHGMERDPGAEYAAFVVVNSTTAEFAVIPVVIGNEISKEMKTLGDIVSIIEKTGQLLDITLDEIVILESDRNSGNTNRLLEILDTFSGNDSNIWDEDLDFPTLLSLRAESLFANADLFLEESVFSSLEPFMNGRLTGKDIEKILKTFALEDDRKSASGLYIMKPLVIDITGKKSYFYEQHYIMQIYNAMKMGS